jgi:photosynthetic reaction center cytochrome c subunit
MKHIKLMPWLYKTVFLVLATLVLSACERPPVDTVQRGYRGLGKVQNYNPRTLDKLAAANVAPEALPPVDDSGPRASEVFQNVTVLGDLSVGQFTRLMTAITSWVAPEQGCGYCHNLQDLASDEIYTKDVARAMLKMTIATNQQWQAHVGDTGVTCYTCHRGKAIPEEVWAASPPPRHARGIARPMQNIASQSVGLTSLPFDPFLPFFSNANDIRVVSTSALPDGSGKSIKQAEWTYGLMMHFADALGVNCTYCHNSRSFVSWEQSPPEREKAWNAIRHVRELNGVIEGVAGILPAERKGVLGDPFKVNCKTCHQGVYRPLFGAKMARNYPELAGKE